MNPTTNLAEVSISEVWSALGGQPPRHGRAPAFWRGSKDANVAIDGNRGIWHDHAQGEGGGVLALIQIALGCDKAGAVEWLESNGFIAARNLTPEQLNYERQRRANFNRELPDAQYWRTSFLDVIENVLTDLKTRLFDPAAAKPKDGEILQFERLLSDLRSFNDHLLVEAYRDYRANWPFLTEKFIQVARSREAADRRALKDYLGVK